MGKIIIKGDFTLEGDVPALDKVGKRFEFVELVTIELPSVRLNQFKCIDEKPKKFVPLNSREEEVGYGK